MKLLYNNNVIIAKSATKPKFKGRGRTWDTVSIKINDELIDVHLDTTWGKNFYFMYQNKWYSISLYNENCTTDPLSNFLVFQK